MKDVVRGLINCLGGAVHPETQALHLLAEVAVEVAPGVEDVYVAGGVSGFDGFDVWDEGDQVQGKPDEDLAVDVQPPVGRLRRS